MHEVCRGYGAGRWSGRVVALNAMQYLHSEYHVLREVMTGTIKDGAIDMTLQADDASPGT